MATASHEHIPDLSASLSKSHHHRAPISDLWGPSLSQRRSNEMVSDYAMEIAVDTSRGPLMSSASSTATHDVGDETNPVKDPSVAISAKVGSGLWSPGLTGNASAPTGSAPPASTGAGAPLHLRSLTTSNSPSYRGPAAATTAVNNVTPLGHFRSGIWGPRQSFGSFNAPAGFNQPPSAGSVYAKTPWSVDLPPASSVGNPANGASIGAVPGTTSAVPSPANAVPTSASVPVQNGFYGMPNTVPGPIPAGPNSLQNEFISTPQTSPSPSENSVGMSAAHLYQSRVNSLAAGSLPSTPSQHTQHGTQAIRNHQVAHDGRPPKKNGRPSTNTELYKTELCASYMSSGGNCPYGEKCQFAHGPEELKSVDRPPKWRSKPCQNWVKTGSCSYNERCCFRHDVPVGHNQQ